MGLQLGWCYDEEACSDLNLVMQSLLFVTQRPYPGQAILPVPHTQGRHTHDEDAFIPRSGHDTPSPQSRQKAHVMIIVPVRVENALLGQEA
jgi:hypothetical protein